MKITLGSNIASLMAQRSLKEGSSALSKALERLSSGMRINRAGDDAAGLAIADDLNADRRVFSQGIRNLNDGLSLLNVADGALQELSGIVTRIRELASQSANGTLGVQQRASIEEEAQALSDEYTRIARTTKFNGLNLFTGESGELRLQAGYGADGGIESGLGGAIGDGSFTRSKDLSIGNFPESSVVGDFNGDGVPDIAVADSSDDAVHILLGTGNGGYASGTAYSVGDGPQLVKTGDFNGDGILDLATNDSGIDPTASILIGRGDGTFNDAVSYITGHTPSDISIGDFNGDGISDFVTANWSPDTLSVYFGKGDGTLEAGDTLTSGTDVVSVATVDLNGDAITDIVAADIGTSTVSVFLGSGDGTFGSRTAYNTGSTPFHVLTADFNGDNIQDVMTVDNGDSTVSILIGQGDGTLGTANAYSLGSDPYMAATGDFNGDGQIDIAVTDRTDDNVSILIGKGDGTFASRKTFGTGSSPRGVTAADLNGDGVLDLVVAAGSGELSILTANTNDGVSPILPFSLKNKHEALQAMSMLEQTQERLSSQRATVGAFQSRVGHAISALTSTVENFTAAESRIRDADIAEEAARMVRMQILQQVGTAILAQANQQPALALQLLQG